ncbi:MAG TPA: 2Fe-2S iron-sulfur cluster-binding protein [Syntrophales bacterium]|nr:2Fe-2S iron-sulfur cluster-binding protein [Syntrophales bacterium]
MKKIAVKVLRYDPEGANKDRFEEFKVAVEEKSTVLEILMQIYDTQDSSLAFNHGCRAKNCGLCAVNVNGHPRYACVSEITANAEISPLKHLPLIRDLIFDRDPFFNYLEEFRPYIVREKYPETEPETLIQSPEHSRLMGCLECFACLSSCPKYDYQDSSFGGPLGFVKLAQLHYDLRDSLDRASQAKKMGILKCIDCSGCTCIAGIPLKQLVIKPFLELLRKQQ